MSLADDLAALRDGRAWVDRSDRGFVVVTGPETFSFLQALVSADLDPLADGDAVHSLLLQPQGKLDVDFRLVRVGDDAWLDCAPGFGGQLAASLTRFRIRVQAEIADRTGELGMLSRIGGDDGVVVPPGVQRVTTEWGHDLVGPRALLPHVGPTVDPRAYDAWRIERGIPVQPGDVDDATIPQEAELELDAVSFSKGCFIGQELVCRIDSRGHVNRFLRRLVDIEGARPGAGGEIVADDKVVGRVTSVTDDAFPALALGYVRRELEPGAVVTLRSAAGDATATVSALRD